MNGTTVSSQILEVGPLGRLQFSLSVVSDGRLVAYHWFVEQENSQELRLVAINDPARPRVLFKTLRPE